LKTPIVKALASAILLCLPATQIFASPAVPPSDTTRKPLLAAADEKQDAVIILKEANVEFPDILAGNEKQSIDYIEKFSVSRKGYLMRTYNRSKKLFPKAAAILKKYNVPQEFKILLALESGFNAEARSSAGAVGYWQIMDAVAKEYGLKIPVEKKVDKKKMAKADKKKHKTIPVAVDERKNFTRSTHAAARYLKDRSRNLNNDWLLIAASYNCGVGNVWNAMERSGKKNPTFWDIKNLLPAETRAYVMNFIAMNVVFNNYEKFSKNTLCFKPVTCKASDTENFSLIGINASL